MVNKQTAILAWPTFSFIVRVDRLVRPVYPDWVKKPMHPELELAGPAEYDLSKLELWLHDDQKDSMVKGEVIYSHLKATNTLTSCLDLRDGFAIQAKGIAVFRRFFGGKSAFLWRSTAQSLFSRILVPFLCEFGGEIVVDWNWLDRGWYTDHPALKFQQVVPGT